MTNNKMTSQAWRATALFLLLFNHQLLVLIQANHQLLANSTPAISKPSSQPKESNLVADHQATGTSGASRRQYNQQLAEDEYLVGVGIADITGPAADINLVSLIRLIAGAFSETSASSSSSSSSSAFTGGSPSSVGSRRWSAAGPAKCQSPSSQLLLTGRADGPGKMMGQPVHCSTSKRPPDERQLWTQKAGRRTTSTVRPGRILHSYRPWPRAKGLQAPPDPIKQPKKRKRAPDKRQASVSVGQQNLMGYAKPNQDSGGIHLRQFSRSIIVEDGWGSRVLYINLDNGMISQLLRSRVISLLKQHYGPNQFNETNVMLTATHTHSCPGGFFQYMLYNIPSAGFIKQTLDALTGGIMRSVQRAVAGQQPARIYTNRGDLLDASINRSPSAYANNPAEERARYEHDTDKEMFLLRVVASPSGEPLAMVNWFPVHGTSMNNSNHLISSDNKGYAALLFERDFNPAGTLPGRGKFVAIFAQANEGDVSPNTRGPRCVDTGLPCDPLTSTCGNPPRNEKCIASGPGRDQFESTQMIAHKQYFRAKQLFQAAKRPVSGPIRFVHEHIDISEQLVPAYESAALVLAARRQRLGRRRQAVGQLDQPGQPNLTETAGPFRTCKAALGYSFAAGTTDGPGAFDFAQGDTASTMYWNMVRDFLKRPSPEMVQCQQPKPILLATGQMEFPYTWHPRVVPTQLFMLGHRLAIVGLPGEFSTMSGRRVREAVRRVLAGPASADEQPTTVGEPADSLQAQESQQKPAESQRKQVDVVLSGLSNVYSSYITTVEEYELQRYEGGSTLYGPHTLQAYVNQFERLARRLLQPARQHADPLQPPDLTKSLFTLKAGVIFDGSSKQFGATLEDVDTQRVYQPGELVSVSFVAGNPRNDLRQEDSFLYVDRFNSSSSPNWQPVASDASWETKFIWERTNTLLGESRAIIEWQIPTDCQPGAYRIRHLGAHKSLFMQTVSPYQGSSSVFKVAAGGGPSDDQLESMRQLAEQFEQQQQQLSQQQSEQPGGSIQRQEDSSPTSGGTSKARKAAGLLDSLLMAPIRFVRRIIG